MKLTLKPLGPVDPEVLSHLRANLQQFGEVVIGPMAPLPTEALDAEKNQYRATKLFRVCQSPTEDRVLAVTEADLYEENLGWVFGYAQVGGQAAVISLARLHGRQPLTPRLRSRTSAKREEKFLDRCVKEAVHELGHTLGLTHDAHDPRCVMYYSTRLADTDRKSSSFCASCAPRAEATLKHLGT